MKQFFQGFWRQAQVVLFFEFFFTWPTLRWTYRHFVRWPTTLWRWPTSLWNLTFYVIFNKTLKVRLVRCRNQWERSKLSLRTCPSRPHYLESFSELFRINLVSVNNIQGSSSKYRLVILENTWSVILSRLNKFASLFKNS